MSKQITITQNDYGISVEAVFGQSLTGKTVDLTIVRPDNTTVSKVPIITDMVQGKCEYVLAPEDTIQLALYKLYYSAKDSNSNITAQNIVTYFVVPENGGV